MGGTQSVTQVQEVIQQRIMNVVSDVLVNKNTTVDQETSGSQVIRNITVGLLPPNYCPIGTAPGAYDFKNEKTINMTTVLNMANVSSNEICSAIKQQLEQQADAAIKSDKSGTFAVGDNTTVNQSFKISDTTMTNLQSNVEMKLQTYMKQKDRGDQIMENMTMYPPCLTPGQPNPILNNAAYITMMATDITSSAPRRQCG
jgi:hypothetical protein